LLELKQGRSENAANGPPRNRLPDAIKNLLSHSGALLAGAFYGSTWPSVMSHP
jgi:hypothetical protein